MPDASGDIETFVCGADVAYALPKPLCPDAHAFPEGDAESPAAVWPCAVWVWMGISVCSSVTLSTPLISPRSRRLNPWPCPQCMGDRPCKSGKPNVDLPSPP